MRHSFCSKILKCCGRVFLGALLSLTASHLHRPSNKSNILPVFLASSLQAIRALDCLVACAAFTASSCTACFVAGHAVIARTNSPASLSVQPPALDHSVSACLRSYPPCLPVLSAPGAPLLLQRYLCPLLCLVHHPTFSLRSST